MAKHQDQAPCDGEKSHPTAPQPSHSYTCREWAQTRETRLGQRGEVDSIPWALTPDLPLQKFTVYMGGWGGCQSYHPGTAAA